MFSYPKSSRVSSGFTLIELLIVVAIIGILAAIAIPNFLQAQVRSKVARTQADMRNVAGAVEMYFVDQNKYPVFSLTPQAFSVPASGNITADPCLQSNAGLTTPVDYMTSIPVDPFGKVQPDDPFTFGGGSTIADGYYYNTKDWFGCRGFAWRVYSDEAETREALWMLLSKGPDKYFANPSGGGVEEVDRPVKWQYDPTNGTVSSGNIVRFGP
jgi:type II secretion system protein G